MTSNQVGGMPTPKCPVCGGEMGDAYVGDNHRHIWLCIKTLECFMSPIDVEDYLNNRVVELEAENVALRAEKHRIPDRYCPLCHSETEYYDGYHCTGCDWSQWDSEVNPLTAEQCIAALKAQIVVKPDYRKARGVLKGITDDEPAEVAIRCLRDGIEWHEHREVYTFDDMIDESMSSAEKPDEGEEQII